MGTVRINKFDNLKGLAILMIVFRHLRPFNVFPTLLVKFVFIVSLPLFFFVAGYFSKTTSDQPVKIFKRLLVPYLIFTILFNLSEFMMTGKFSPDLLFIQTESGLWFLLVLFFMKLGLPIAEKFRYPILSFCFAALFFGIIDVKSSFLGLTRLFGYFPVFLLGFYYETLKEKFIRVLPKIYDLCNRHFRVIFALSIIAALLVISNMDYELIGFTRPYGGNILYEIIKRAAVIAVMFSMVLIISRAMTDNHTFLTKFGKNSMAVYLLHLFILVFIRDLQSYYIINDAVTMLVSLIGVFAITFVLSRDPVTKYLNMFTDFISDLILKPGV